MIAVPVCFLSFFLPLLHLVLFINCQLREPSTNNVMLKYYHHTVPTTISISQSIYALFESTHFVSDSKIDKQGIQIPPVVLEKDPTNPA